MSLKPMFDRVTRRYDLLNRVLTWTLDESWREACAREYFAGRIVVDICCGTGSLSFRILNHVTSETCVVGLDFSKEMLGEAVEKKRRYKVKCNLGFVLADVAFLPIRTANVDCLGTSFSFRNLVYRNSKARVYLAEILRTLRFGGKFVFVETSQPKSIALRMLYHLYLLRIVPIIGWLFSRKRSPYLYLGRSAANFPSAEKISRLLLANRFRETSFTHLAMGIVALHRGLK